MKRSPRDSEPYVTLDGSLIYEVVRPEFSRVKTVSLAVAEVPPGESTVPHYHDFDEVYWVLEGRGIVHVGSSLWRFIRRTVWKSPVARYTGSRTTARRR
ncbi:cupin domain-containing protein [Methanopyrus sp.]